MQVLLAMGWLWLELLVGLMLWNFAMSLDWKCWADRCFGISLGGVLIGIAFYDKFIPWTSSFQLALFMNFFTCAVILLSSIVLREVHLNDRKQGSGCSGPNRA